MQSLFSKRTIVTIIVIGLFGIFLVLYLTFRGGSSPDVSLSKESESFVPIHTIIGKSVEGRNIDAYAYGNGKTHLAFVGGVHGGYEWNSVVVAYKLMDYFVANPEVIPQSLTVIIIPDANPDGVYKVIHKEGRFTALAIPEGSTVPGRFNANNVDLNRNFDCKWQPKSTWQEKVVSGGTSVFSEPEALAIRNFVQNTDPVAVVFWHSQSGSVYASQCEHGILPETLNIMNAYAKASGYSAVKTFDAYQTSGDSEGWLAKIGIPAITVELKTHETVEFEQNLAGVKALLQYYK